MTSPRIEQALRDLGLRYQLREAADDPENIRVVTGFIDTAISFALIDSELKAEGRWRGEVTQNQAARVLEATRQLNEANFLPVFFVAEGSTPASLGVRSRGRLPISVGATDQQLTDFLVFFLRQTAAAFERLAKLFPESVDWDDPHAQHESQR